MGDATPVGIKISVVDASKLEVPMKTEKQMKTKKPERNGEPRQPSYLVIFAAEVIGTGLLMFLGCMGSIWPMTGPLTFGLTVMTIIQTFGHISGAHLNPAVTISAVLFGLVKPLMGFVYVIAEFVGATLGYGLLKVLASDYIGEGFCTTVIDPKISTVQALGIEIVITTLLIFVCAACWDKRNANKADSVPLKFGFVIASISFVSGPLTGASMNTARSFAPLVFGGSWKDQWIYWVGPNVAAIIGTYIYKFVFALQERDEEKPENIYLEDGSNHTAQKV